MTPVEVIRGDGPVILGQPHGGTFVPDDLRVRLNDRGRALTDTDWHIGRLYDGLLPWATVVRATFHRYVIDANRDPSGVSLYPGQNTTGLCPETDFDGQPIWEDGQGPSQGEIAERVRAFHAPYHAALAAEITRVRARHGHAIVWDCHSIRSVIPFLFEGRLPDLNIGTNGGVTCAPEIERMVAEGCGITTSDMVARATEGSARPAGWVRKRPPRGGGSGVARAADAARAVGNATSPASFTAVLNGRFKGGWTTRHYGRPGEGIHAIQMEIVQFAYLQAEAAPWTYDEAKAAPLRTLLARILSDLARWRP